MIWEQLRVPLKVALRSRDLIVDIQKKHLKVGVKNQAPIIDDHLPYEVKKEESTWLIEDKTTLLISIEKVSLVLPLFIVRPSLMTAVVTPKLLLLLLLVTGQQNGMVESPFSLRSGDQYS